MGQHVAEGHEDINNLENTMTDGSNSTRPDTHGISYFTPISMQ